MEIGKVLEAQTFAVELCAGCKVSMQLKKPLKSHMLVTCQNDIQELPTNQIESDLLPDYYFMIDMTPLHLQPFLNLPECAQKQESI